MLGVPMEWDSSIATMKSLIASRHIAWSPCSRFIVATIDGFNRVTGVESEGGAQILDAVTLERLGSFAPPQSRTFPWSPCQLLTFSPERSLLTWVSGSPKGIFSWDVQTGVLVSGIPIEGKPTMFSSITYSQCGTMFGVSLDYDGVTVIGTYNALSGIPKSYHPIQGLIARTIWTHGECLRFATLEPGSITVWELEYASEYPVTEVESLPIPDNFYLHRNYLLLPTLSRLAFILEETILVWDARRSKLLDSADVEEPENPTFSSDGRFFAYNRGPEIYLWKESPAGYVLHQKLKSGKTPRTLLLSPDGQSIVASDDRTFWLWRTADSTPSPSRVPTEAIRHPERFIVEFLPDESLIAVARLTKTWVVVLDLKSDVQPVRLVINTDMEVYGLKVTGSTVVVAGVGKVVTWNLWNRSAFDVAVDDNDSVRTTTLDQSPFFGLMFSPFVAVSPDSNHITVAGKPTLGDMSLDIYDAATGEHLARTEPQHKAKFAPDGREVWGYFLPLSEDILLWATDNCELGFTSLGWAIVGDFESGLPMLENFIRNVEGPPIFPWESLRDYGIEDQRWVLEPQ